MEARGATAGRGWAARLPAWLLGLVPLLLIVAAVGAVRRARRRPGSASGAGRRPRSWRSSARCSTPGVIELTVRNDGPDAVSVAQAHGQRRVRRSSPAPTAPIGRLETATRADPAAVGRGRGLRGRAVTSTGGDDRARDPRRGRDARRPTSSFFGLMALLGIYVGVIPIALGMLWLPWMRRIPPRWLRVVMALTVGLLGVPRRSTRRSRASSWPARARRRSAARRSCSSARVGRLPAADRRRRRGCSGAAAPARGLGRPRWRCWSRSGSGCTTSARAWRSARPTPPARSRSARSSSSASRSTTPPRAWRSSRRSRTSARRSGGSRVLGLIAGAPAVLGAWIGAAAFNASARRVPVRLRRRRDRAGDRPARADRCATSTAALLHPARGRRPAGRAWR